MFYIKKFNNDSERSNYIKSNFVSPHLFLDTQNKNINYFPKYKRLDYISSTTTGGQYIDLGCKLMENTDDIKIDIKFNIKDRGKDGKTNNTGQSTLIASQLETSPYPGFTLRYRVYNFNYIHLQAKWQFTNSSPVPSESGKWASKYLSINNEVYDNNIYEFSETLDNIPASQCNNMNCHLFCALNGSNQPFRFVTADLYYLKFTKGGQVIRNLIPVQRNSDNEVGLWDMENQVFYTSQGDEPFIAGINE